MSVPHYERGEGERGRESAQAGRQAHRGRVRGCLPACSGT